MRLAVMITTRVGKTTRLCAETMQVSEAHKEGSSDDCMADDRNRYVMSLSSLAFQCRHTPMLERSGTMAHFNLEKTGRPSFVG